MRTTGAGMAKAGKALIRDLLALRFRRGGRKATSSTRARRAAGAAGAMLVLALALGFAIGAFVFLVMKLTNLLTSLLWSFWLDGQPGGHAFAAYPLLACTAGGFLIGAWTHFAHASVEPLEDVMGEFRATGSYRIRPVKGTVAFALPLVFGGSVGFEAGLTGIVVSASCWIRDRLKAAGLRAATVADVSVSAAIAAIFGAPLAGIVAGAEADPQGRPASTQPPASESPMPDVSDLDAWDMRRSAKLALYTAAAVGALAALKAMAAIVGSASGLPQFGPIKAHGPGFLWALAALGAAWLLAAAYRASETAAGALARRARKASGWADLFLPIAAGAILGAAACVLPYVLFPGEEQAHELIESWGAWGAAVLLATGVLKAAATPMCIAFGWRGGHLFPTIFAAAATGYGLAALTGADPVLMVTVAVTALLGAITRKPLLAAAIVLLCFPLESALWCALAAVLGAALPLPGCIEAEAEKPRFGPER